MIMNKGKICAFLLAVILICSGTAHTFEKIKEKTGPMKEFKTEIIKLPEPIKDSATSIEEALLNRRSVRSYKDSPLTLSEVSQLLWAAQGVTSARGLRTAPSAGALYPLEVYVVSGNVDGLPDGVYQYRPDKHEIALVVRGDKRGELCRAALGQTSVRNAAAVIVFSAVYERTGMKYGDRGIQYVHMETGHAAQNVFLQAVPLELGTVVIGAFYDGAVREVLKMPDGEQPLYIMPVGRKK
jgi:SagB-type dehydrogenase family enzyme